MGLTILSHRLPFAVAITMLGMAWSHPSVVDKPLVQEPRVVRVQTVALTTDRPTMVYSGTVRAHVQVDLGFRIAGKVLTRPIKIGDRVSAGQVLATLDPTDERLAVEAAESLAAAAQAEAIDAHAEFARYEQLGRGSAAFVPSEYDKRRMAMLAADARLARAEHQESMAKSELQHTTLAAEADGVIVTLPVEVGQVVSAGQTVASLAETGAMEVLADVPEKRLDALRTAQDISVTLWAAPGEVLHGTLCEVGALADPVSRTFAVKVCLPNPPPDLLALGMTAAVRFVGPSSAPHAVLPASALYGSRAEPSVWVLNEQTRRAVRRQVEILSFSGDGKVMVGGGLSNGDKVVTAGADLIDGEMLLSAWAGPTR